MMQWVTSVDGLYDFIGYVVLSAPNSFPIEDYLPPEQQMTLGMAFDELRRGIDLLPMADDAKRTRLSSVLDQALAAYRVGDVFRGAHLVQDFQDLIFKRND